MHPVDEYELVSFELTDNWFAWFADDEHNLFSHRIDAIGLAKFSTVWYDGGREIRRGFITMVLCGVYVDDMGCTDVVQTSGNFIAMLRTGETPSEVAVAAYRKANPIRDIKTITKLDAAQELEQLASESKDA